MMDDTEDGGIQFEAVQRQASSDCRPEEVVQHRITIASPRMHSLQLAWEVTLEVGALQGMKQHALRDPSTELGGILIGHHWESYDREPQRGIWIRHFIEAEAYESTRASFKFTHDSWARIMEEKRSRFPDQEIVGWYHTHPGWGVFLSGHDHFICNHFFPDWFQLAIVLDPSQLIWGVFDRSLSNEMQIRTGLFLRSAQMKQSDLDALRDSIQTNELGLFSLRSIATMNGSIPCSGNANPQGSTNQGDDGVQKEGP